MSGTNKRRSMQQFGVLLMVVGLFFVIGGLIGLNAPIMGQGCPVNGCSPGGLWQIYGIYYVSLYLGIALIIAGISLLVASRFVREPRASVSQTEAPARENLQSLRK